MLSGLESGLPRVAERDDPVAKENRAFVQRYHSLMHAVFQLIGSDI